MNFNIENTETLVMRIFIHRKLVLTPKIGKCNENDIDAEIHSR